MQTEKTTPSVVCSTVYVISSNPLIADAIIRTGKVAKRFCISVHGTFSCQLVHRANSNHAIFILDWGSPSLASKGIVTILDAQAPASRKIVLGDLSPDEMCYCLSWGIHGFIEYRKASRELEAALATVLTGRLYMPRAILERYVIFSRARRHKSSSRTVILTPRQKQILMYLQGKKTNKEISSELQISESTVKFHLAKLFGKLGAHDRHTLAYLNGSDLPPGTAHKIIDTRVS